MQIISFITVKYVHISHKMSRFVNIYKAYKYIKTLGKKLYCLKVPGYKMKITFLWYTVNASQVETLAWCYSLSFSEVIDCYFNFCDLCGKPHSTKLVEQVSKC